MKKIIIIVAALVIVVAAALRLVSVRTKNTAQNTDAVLVNEVSVNIAKAKLSNDAFIINSTGCLYPIKTLDIPAETQGKITSINLKLGQKISVGSTIATIDNTIKKISCESAKIDLDKQKKEYDRTVTLFKGGTATEQEVESSKLSYETAKLKLEESEKQLAYTNIKSSISGQVTQKNIELGTFVNTGTVIASIVDVSKLKVKFYLSENNVYDVKIGDKAKLTSDVFPGKTFEGKITYISPSAEESYNYLIELELPNDKLNSMKAGTFVNIQIEVPSKKESIYIPRQALQGSIKNAKVYLAIDNKAALRDIVIGRSNNDYLEVLSGVSATDNIIVSGLVNLTNGKPIKIINNN